MNPSNHRSLSPGSTPSASFKYQIQILPVVIHGGGGGDVRGGKEGRPRTAAECVMDSKQYSPVLSTFVSTPPPPLEESRRLCAPATYRYGTVHCPELPLPNLSEFDLSLPPPPPNPPSPHPSCISNPCLTTHRIFHLRLLRLI